MHLVLSPWQILHSLSFKVLGFCDVLKCLVCIDASSAFLSTLAEPPSAKRARWSLLCYKNWSKPIGERKSCYDVSRHEFLPSFHRVFFVPYCFKTLKTRLNNQNLSNEHTFGAFQGVGEEKSLTP